ncbi:MAG: ribonuclease H-like domain-containing protein [Ardenticatenaceae bacterium]|nr:ribonuclease H-like domain-containing protein [Ardenticatenaceae bacterium]
MAQDWQKKLQRLGVVKGTRHLKPASPAAGKQSPLASPSSPLASPPYSEYDDDVQPLDKLLPGGMIQSTPDGDCFILDNVYPLNHQHGDDKLDSWQAVDWGATAVLTQDPRLADLTCRDCLFLDTETTGLAGAGTVAFMVGAAFVEGDAVVVRQYFLRDHGDEPAMLLLLDELLADKKALVTFNGRSFDLPLLDRRFLMNRLPADLLDRPHIDLLLPARRLWRSRLQSVSLKNLETNLLGVRRTHEDVPGFAIPGLYHDYIRTGDARQMARVFYHNEIDMLSMVTLLPRVIRQFAHADERDHALDLFSLGRWQHQMGLLAEAEQNLRHALAGELSLELYHQTLYELANLLKRNGRRAEALLLWQQIAATTFDDVAAHVELAMHYEWQEKDVTMALRWTEQAVQLANSMGTNGRSLRDELEHRLARLQAKVGDERD